MMFKQFMIITSNNLDYYFVLGISIQHRWQRSLTFVSPNGINLQVQLHPNQCHRQKSYNIDAYSDIQINPGCKRHILIIVMRILLCLSN